MKMKYIAICALLGAPIIGLSAQVAPSASDCSNAVAALVAGSLAVPDSQVQAATIIGACGKIGDSAAAIAMRRRRLEPLTLSTRIVFLGSIGDTARLSAALDLATDASASAVARILALIQLTEYMPEGGPIEYATVAAMNTGDVCLVARRDSLVRSNLPSNVDLIIKTPIAAIEHDASATMGIRGGANCVMNAWRVGHGFRPQPSHTYTTSPLQVEHICGTRFRIKNPASFPMPVTYQVGAGPMVEYDVPSAPWGSSYSQTDINVRAAGALVLYVDGVAVATATPNGRACT